MGRRDHRRSVSANPGQLHGRGGLPRLLWERVVPALALATSIADAASAGLEFNRDIRPVLSENCFACHGFDTNSRKAKLRLDTQQGAFEVRDGVPAISPGNLENSALWHRVTSSDPDERMPPPQSHKQLTGEQVSLLKRWIEQGANYQPHWAFVPPDRLTPPATTAPERARNPIDQFIQVRLDAEGLEPAPQAERTTLLRRVTLDLTGLPPTPAELDAFLQDPAPGAYGRVVDRLMTTRDYAERRAQDWLDLARHADTRGFADDKTREIWPYRDWVVRALHHNMPFDQFTIEQLAGDMLPGATGEQRLATAFHRNAPQARGQTYPVEEYRLKGVTDRINTTGKVWFGLTLECAECHDHKFDPISQRDYYALFAFFNNIEHGGKGMQQGGPTMPYNPAPRPIDAQQSAERQQLEAALQQARERLPSAKIPGAAGLLGKWDGAQTDTGNGKFNLTADLTITARIATRQPVANIVSKYDWQGGQRSYVFGIGGEGEKEASPGHLFFWVSSKTDPFAGISVYGSRPVNDGQEHHVTIVFDAGSSVRLFVDGIEDKTARTIGTVPKSIAISDRHLAIGAGYQSSTEPNAHRFVGTLADVRLYAQTIDDPLGLGAAGDKVADLQAALHEFDREKAKAATKTIAVPVMRERSEPRETFIHLRGSFLSPGPEVSPALPAILNTDGTAKPRDRLGFARWLVDGNNPLVARVAVNRFWQTYFGHGLVRTPDDFGSQGTPPTHPDLLDWLAGEFVDSGWDMKHIHRLIVTSATYRQSARITPALTEHDPKNLLLARAPRLRLPAEQIRDQALAVSGLLKPYSGGPSVFPPQPANYWEDRDLPGQWRTSHGDDRHRKSLYTYWRRMALHPTMELLDAPARDVCVVQRNAANLPTQALVTLNAPVFVAAANHLARELISSSSDPPTRLDLAFKRCLSRPPDPAERDRFLQFLQAESPGDPNQLAAWMSIATVLLNLDETITRP